MIKDFKQFKHKKQIVKRKTSKLKWKEQSTGKEFKKLKLKEQSVKRESEELGKDLWKCVKVAGLKN